MRPKIPQNSLRALDYRKYGCYGRSMKNVYRFNNTLMRNLIASPNWRFQLVMKMKTAKAVEFECPDKLYVDNNRKCYALRGPECKPILMYKINSPKRGQRFRYEMNITITRAGMANPNPPPCDLRLLLNNMDQVEVRVEASGKLLYSIDLSSPDSPSVHYRCMRWDLNLDQVIVSSTRTPSSSKDCCYFVILDLCHMVTKSLRVPISRKVFGKDIRNAVLFDGILQACYSNRTVKVFDFNQIRQLNPVIDGAVDRVLHIRTLPPAVLEIPVGDEHLMLGGYPWHYISRVPAQESFVVRSLDNREIAVFDQTDYHCMHSVNFHPDDTGVIVRSMNDKLVYYKLVETGDQSGTCRLEKIREFRLVPTKNENSPTPPPSQPSPPRERSFALRRSARVSELSRLGQSPFSYSFPDRELFSDDYENELNINLLFGIDKSDPGESGVLQMFDNYTGQLLNTMKFNRTLHEQTDYNLTLDLDVLILNVRQEGRRLSDTLIYRLVNIDSLPEQDKALQTLDLPIPIDYEEMQSQREPRRPSLWFGVQAAL